MATTIEVDHAFRFLLGRPATPAERLQWAAHPVEQLRHDLMATDEFRAALPGDAVLMPLNLPPSQVAWFADANTLAALLDRVQARWVQLGQQRPHWSTDSRQEFAPDRIDDNMGLFEATGDGEIAALVATLARHGLTPAQLPRVVDFGCGVGRLTKPLAKVFQRVTGCDVSPPHLMLARAATGPNVGYSLVSVPEFGMAEPFDLWFSTVTLQHNPPPVITMILRRAFALLAPGGLAIFQLPTERIGYGFDPAAYLAAPLDPDVVEIHALPQSVVFSLAAEAHCVPLEVREDGLVWPPTLCLSNRFIIAKPRNAPAPTVLARR